MGGGEFFWTSSSGSLATIIIALRCSLPFSEGCVAGRMCVYVLLHPVSASSFYCCVGFTAFSPSLRMQQQRQAHTPTLVLMVTTRSTIKQQTKIKKISYSCVFSRPLSNTRTHTPTHTDARARALLFCVYSYCGGSLSFARLCFAQFESSSSVRNAHEVPGEGSWKRK